MAHFAEINSDNEVIRVLVVPDEQEHRGQEFLANDLGLGGNWIQTSFNNKIRKQFAGIGFIYNSELDIFISPRPFDSWQLDENYDWQAPSPKPDGYYFWDEESQNWINAETV